jgi:hypothetical protein
MFYFTTMNYLLMILIAWLFQYVDYNLKLINIGYSQLNGNINCYFLQVLEQWMEKVL